MHSNYLGKNGIKVFNEYNNLKAIDIPLFLQSFKIERGVRVVEGARLESV